jgi:ribose-phosphate pyrophosphokinase
MQVLTSVSGNGTILVADELLSITPSIVFKSMNRPILFATQAYQYLLEELLAQAPDRWERGEVTVKYFPDGERYQRILTEVRQRTVVLVGGTIDDPNTLELYDLACALVKYGAETLTLVVPYFGYATMERAVKRGEVVTAKTRARLLSSIPYADKHNRLVMIDLHVAGMEYYFENHVRPVHLYAKELVIEAARAFGETDFVLACTDAGRAKWVESLANDIGVEAAFVFKRRLSGSQTAITGINAEVRGRKVVIYDDMIRTGGSLINAAQAYHHAGAEEVYAITTHGLFSNNALERLQHSGLFKQVACTNTHATVEQWRDNPFLLIKSVAPLLNQYLIEDTHNF